MFTCGCAEIEDRNFKHNDKLNKTKIKQLFYNVKNSKNGPLRRLKSTSHRKHFKSSQILFLALILFNIFGRGNSILRNYDDFDDDGLEPVLMRGRRNAETFKTVKDKDAENLIPANYSIHHPPPTPDGSPTDVDFSVLIMNVRDIKELSEELSLEMNLRVYWKDSRLHHLSDNLEADEPFVVLNPVLIDKLWHPDVFIDHVKTISQQALLSKPASLRIYPDSNVRYSVRLTVAMACQMDFHYYPADTQRCYVDMKSYAYTDKTIVLAWRENKEAYLVDSLNLPNFDVSLETTSNFRQNTSSGSYSGIRFAVILRRQLSYHLIQTYLPSTLFIIVSWLSFLVPPESVPGRMALCMTTLLTLTAMFASVRQNTPNVSYVKALDIWMVVCIIFVFLTLLEYTVILKLKSKKPKKKKGKKPKAEKPKRNLSPEYTEGTFRTLNAQNESPQSPIGSVGSIGYKNYGEYPTIQIRRAKLTETSLMSGLSGNGIADMRNLSEPTISNAPPTPQPPPPIPDKDKYEIAVKNIEKFTGAIIPALFVIFNFIYWPWLIRSAKFYNDPNTFY